MHYLEILMGFLVTSINFKENILSCAFKGLASKMQGLVFS